MRRVATSIVGIAIFCSIFLGGAGRYIGIGFSGAVAQVRANQRANQQQSPSSRRSGRTKQLIDIKADIVYPFKVNDTLTVMCLVGNFAAQHNGAVITADSAVRYGDDRLECFGNVLINKNTTYAYADRADYDGERNVASLYAPLIKVVDQEMTMYTYNFEFNTKDNVGRYWGGGVMRRHDEEKEASDDASDDVMVAQRGYFYSEEEQLVGVEGVEVRGEGYLMSGDSVIYDMANERIRFFSRTNIWNSDDDYIYGDSGVYDKTNGRYEVDKNGYMLRPEQEVWGDTMIYYSERKQAILRNNIQLDDTKNKAMAFGDYIQYWGDDERILMTRNPALVSYDRSQQMDSLFLRADTIMLMSYAVGSGPISDAANDKGFDTSIFDELDMHNENSYTPNEGQVDENIEEEGGDVAAVEQTEEVEDEGEDNEEEVKEVTNLPSKSKAELRAEQNEAIREEKLAAKRRVDSIKEYRKMMVREERLQAKIEQRVERGRSIYTDSMLLLRVQETKNQLAPNIELDSLIAWEGRVKWRDRILGIQYDAMGRPIMPKDTTALDSIALERSAEEESDSMYRVVVAYRNVRSYNSDFQMVGDSMILQTLDSIAHLYISPVVWSESNQIASEQMDIYVKNRELDYGDFIGAPVMSSQVRQNDSIYYNQISGKAMRVFFTDNNVTRNDVDGNVETIYFMQDDDNRDDVNTIVKVESGNASFYIEEQQLDGATYRSDPTYVIAPLDKMPTELTLYLKDFEWYGARRPTRNDVLDREIRATRREEVESIERPKFTLLQKIDADRVRLRRNGTWRDREDKVSPASARWMQSLGYTPGEPRPEGARL